MSMRDQRIGAGLTAHARASTGGQREAELESLAPWVESDTAFEQRLAVLGRTPDVGAHARLLQQVAAHHHSNMHDTVLRMNRLYGNRHVNRVLNAARSGQGDLAEHAVGAPDDRHEREADRVAARVAGEIGKPVAPNSDSEGLARPQSAGDGGRPLPDPVREPMEQALGVDFSGVRVHTDAGAARRSDDLQARAFTKDTDLYFAPGEYAPHTPRGQMLLAHELTHVVQQTGGAAERARAGVSAAEGGTIQRALKGTAANLREEAGEVSKKAKLKGLATGGLGKSTYTLILEAVERYEAEEDRVERGEQPKDVGVYTEMLQKIIDLISKWLQSNQGPDRVLKPEDVTRGQVLSRLQFTVSQEIDLVERLGGPDTAVLRERAQARRQAQARAEERGRGEPSAGATASPRQPVRFVRPQPQGATAAPSRQPVRYARPKPPPGPPPVLQRSAVSRGGRDQAAGATAASKTGRSHYVELEFPRKPPRSGRPAKGKERKTQYAKLDFRAMESGATASGAQPLSLPTRQPGPPVPPRSAISLGQRARRPDATEFRRNELVEERKVADALIGNAQDRLTEIEEERNAFRAQGRRWARSRYFRDSSGNMIGPQAYYENQIRMLRRVILDCSDQIDQINEALEDL